MLRVLCIVCEVCYVGRMTIREARKLVRFLVQTQSESCRVCDTDTLKEQLQIEFPWFDWPMIWRHSEEAMLGIRPWSKED